MRPREVWFWLGAGFLTVGAVLTAVAIAYFTKETHYSLSTGPQMVTAYASFAFAFLCFFAAIAGWRPWLRWQRFPNITVRVDTEIERPAFESFLVVDQHLWRLSELRRPAWPWWGALVDTHAVCAAFDAQIRRNTRAGERGAVVEADAGVLRWLAPGTQTSRITWSELARAVLCGIFQA